MARLGLVLAGVVLGAAAGLTAGLVLVYAWFELLGLPGLTDDPKGLTTAMLLIGPAILIGAVGSPIWLVRRRRRGLSTRAPLVALALLAGIAALLWVGLLM